LCRHPPPSMRVTKMCIDLKPKHYAEMDEKCDINDRL
jgi:hypothetical protein